MTVDLATFCRAPFVELADVERGAVAVIGVRDVCGGRSSSQAAAAIRRASLAMFDDLASAGRLVDIDAGHSLVSTASLVDIGDVGLDGSPVDRVVESVGHAGAVPVVLGSERSLTHMGFTGFCRGREARQERVGLICLSPDLDIVFGIQSFARSDQTVAEPILLGPMDPRHTAVLGLHGLVPHRYWRRVSELGVTVVPSSTIASSGVEAAAREALSTATSGTDAVFVAVDLSVVDLGHAPGRIGAKVTGLEASELLDLCGILRSAKIAGVALGGLDADMDPTDRSAALVAQVVMQLVAPPAFAERPAESRSGSHAAG